MTHEKRLIPVCHKTNLLGLQTFFRDKLPTRANNGSCVEDIWKNYKEKAEALVVATKEIALEGNADKTKYMFMSREQTAGLSHTMKVDNSSIESVEEFKYLGKTLTNQNSIRK